MKFAYEEFHYVGSATKIPEWLEGLDGDVKHFDMLLVEVPPNVRRIVVVAMYEEYELCYTYTLPVATDEEVAQ